MVFGLVNKTKWVAVRVGAFGINLGWGIVEEVTFNITKAHPANAMDVVVPNRVVPNSQTSNISKKIAYSAGASLAGSAIKNNIIDIISKATFTGII